jgi:hypothetical protein
MRTVTTAVKPSRAIVLGLVVLIALLVATPVALAADRESVVAYASGAEIVKVGEDIFVGPGQIVDSVTVFGGDAVIAGTVRHTVVAVGGDIALRATARVGTQMNAADQSVLAIGGTARTAPGATVIGTTGAWEDVSAGEATIAAAIAFTGVVIGAVIGASFLALLAVIVLTISTIFALAAFAGLVWFILWLVRRENRKSSATTMTPGAGYGYPEPTAAQATQATQPYAGPAFTAPPTTP